MKLTSAQVERALSQFEAQALPDSHPAVPKLSELFGDHTFFVDAKGLNVMEPTAAAAKGEGESAKVVNLATWQDETFTTLVPHEPQPTDVVIALGSEH
jgi:hypothetical protein